MGYYTRHELSVRKHGKDQSWAKEEIDAIVNALKEREVWNYAFNGHNGSVYDCLVFYGDNTVKWYDHDVDMLEISKQFPEYTFQLYGEGEETDDFWFTYYKNGETEYCPAEIIFKEPQVIEWEGDTQY